MKKKYEIIIYSVLVVIGLVIVSLIIRHDYFSNNSVINEDLSNYNSLNKTEDNNFSQTVSDEDKIVDEQEEEKEEENKEETINPSEEKEVTLTEKVEEKKEEKVEEEEEKIEEEKLSTKDIIVINELETIENKTVDLLKENKTSTASKAKGIFITLVDFCFFDGKINDITFKDLTAKGQEKVLQIVNKIDMLIESKFPLYKEKITTKTKQAFTKASELIKKGANNINEFSQEKLGDDNYQAMIEEKDELVLYTKNAWSLVKNFSSSIWQSTKEKLTTWYEKFKNSD